MPVRVLVVDDDEMSRELLAILLQGEGYDVDTADSGEAALALAHGQAQPDIVLTDVQLPGLAGTELAAALRDACGSQTMLFAMSGSEPGEQILSAYDGFLLKPFKVADVMAAVSAHQKASRVVPFSPPEQPHPAGLPIDHRAEPVLNEKIYHQLAKSLPVPQLHEMYTLCISDARERIGRMRDSVHSHDSARFVREAHAIKGSCGMLGAAQLHGMAAELEKTGLHGTEASSQQDVNSLDELSAACDRLERMLGSRV
jgi:CheY-like chemotaxis protein